MTASLQQFAEFVAGLPAYVGGEGRMISADELARRAREALDAEDPIRAAAQVVVDEHAADNPFLGYAIEALEAALAEAAACA